MKILCALILLVSGAAWAQVPANCSTEGGVTGRSDILRCESWESSTWWQASDVKADARKTNPQPAPGPESSSIISSGCVSGNCLRIECRSWANGGCGGALGLVINLPGNHEDLYLRYYLKLAPNWSPANFDVGTGASNSSGGKFTGFGDGRTNADPSFQCGNGGEFADGINCWTMRTKYRDCIHAVNECAPGNTQIGSYWYLGTNPSFSNYAPWADGSLDWFDQTGVNCSTTADMNCGIGSYSGAGHKTGGLLLNDHWYMIEERIKMNTPGTANGLVQVWVNGVLSYQKTNVTYRNVGHDNLHVRQVLLQLHAGGEGVGPANDTYILMDQLLVANSSGWDASSSQRPGAWRKPGAAYTSAFGVTVATQPTGGTCSTTASGSSVLERAANGLAAGNWCEFTGSAAMGGLSWALIQDPNGGNGSVFEYANKGVYDPVRKEVRYVGIADTSPGPPDELKYLIYSASTNQWSTATKPFIQWGSHTWDVNAVDPASGCNYINDPRSANFWRWCGSSWAALPSNAAVSGEILACTWDEKRGGLLCWSERNTGVQLWTPGAGNSLPGTWSEIFSIGGCSGECLNFIAAYDRNSGYVFLGSGNNNNTNYRRYSPTGVMTTHTAPTAIICCGGGGNSKLGVYDYRTGKVVFHNPSGSAKWDLDLATNTWRSLGNAGPPLNNIDPGNTQSIVVAIPDHGGVILYLVRPSVGAAPRAYLYKHN